MFDHVLVSIDGKEGDGRAFAAWVRRFEARPWLEPNSPNTPNPASPAKLSKSNNHFKPTNRYHPSKPTHFTYLPTAPNPPTHIARTLQEGFHRGCDELFSRVMKPVELLLEEANMDPKEVSAY